MRMGSTNEMCRATCEEGTTDMGTTLRSKFTLLFIAFAVAMFVFPAAAFAEVISPDGTTASSTPTIQSDKDDYAPGETVTLTGSNWQPGESVHIYVNDDEGKTWERNSYVTADDGGAIQDQFQLPEWFVATYKVTATDSQSGVATTSFTDGNLIFTTGTSGPAPSSWTVNYTSHNGNNVTPYTSCNDPNPTNGSKTILPGGTPGQQQGTQAVTVNSSVMLGNVTDNSATLEFKKWTSDPAGNNPVTNMCVSGTQGGGTIGTYYAQFGPADTTAPTVSSINRADTNPTNTTGNLSWTVTFSENVSGVNAADFNLASSGLSDSPAIQSVTQGANASVYTVTASTGTGSGSLGLNLNDDDSIVDGVGNKLGGAGLGNGNFTGQVYTIDRTPPAVSSINRADTNPTNTTGNLSWTVTFSENVSGVNAADFNLANSGLSDSPAIQSVTQGANASVYTVTASTGTGSGSLGLNLNDDDSIVDGVGNNLGGTGTTGAANGSFTGQVYTLDRIAPTVTGTAVKGPNFGATDTYTANTWTNQSVRVTFTCEDLGGSLLTTGSGNQILLDYTAETSGTTANFTGTCADNAGNSAAPASFGLIKIDKTLPVITDDSANNAPTGTTLNSSGWYTSQVTNTFRASDGLSGFLSPLTDPYTFTQTSPAGVEGSAVKINSGSVSDQAGNAAAAKDSQAFKIDLNNPTVNITGPAEGAKVDLCASGIPSPSFTASDTSLGSGVDHSLDNGGFTTQPSTATGVGNYTYA